ncbi:MAG: hypothetical protein IJ689_01810 [Alphaproteobacteria bacterium]|nr:hypothetical protein [Alphaproteobacteria bacterium]
MKNYILLIGVAGVALGSYCAYAGNSATMTVTATIAHDISLGNVTDLNIGTITINPASNESGAVYYNLDGTFKSKSGPITAATDATPGTFTANVANSSVCDGAGGKCFFVINDSLAFLSRSAVSANRCTLKILRDSENKFKVVPTECTFRYPDDTDPGTHTKTITIEYRPY